MVVVDTGAVVVLCDCSVKGVTVGLRGRGSCFGFLRFTRVLYLALNTDDGGDEKADQYRCDRDDVAIPQQHSVGLQAGALVGRRECGLHMDGS